MATDGSLDFPLFPKFGVEVAAQTDDILLSWGIAGSTQKSFDQKWFANEASGASYLYMDASANLIYTTGVDLQFKDSDYLVFGTGAGASGDVNITWDATDLHVAAAADDTVINFGNGTNSFDIQIFGNAATDYALFDASANNLDLVGAYKLRVASVGTLAFASAAAGTQTFTVTGLTSDDIVVISSETNKVGLIDVDKVESGKLTLRNSASETASLKVNYLRIAKAV